MMMMLSLCLGLAQASENELVETFAFVAERHQNDFAIAQGCKLFARWSQVHLSRLEPLIRRLGGGADGEPARVRRVLFGGPRSGGYGLLRDIQDILLLVHQGRSAWCALEQAASASRDKELADVADYCGSELDRVADWLGTEIKLIAAQALNVPPPEPDELESSPDKADRYFSGPVTESNAAPRRALSR